MTRRSRFHLDDAIAPVMPPVRGGISEGVLFTNIMSDAFTKWDDVRYGLWEKSLASRGLGKLPERVGLLVRVFLRINTNGIDDRVGFPRYGQDLAQTVFAGIVAPVAHHD